MDTIEFSKYVAANFDHDMLLRNGILALVNVPRPVNLALQDGNVLTFDEVSKLYGARLLNDFKSPYTPRESGIILLESAEEVVDQAYQVGDMQNSRFTQHVRNVWRRNKSLRDVHDRVIRHLRIVNYVSNSAMIADWLMNLSETQEEVLRYNAGVFINSEETLTQFFNSQMWDAYQTLGYALQEYRQGIYQFNLGSNDRVEILLPSDQEVRDMTVARQQACGIIVQDHEGNFYDNEDIGPDRT